MRLALLAFVFFTATAAVAACSCSENRSFLDIVVDELMYADSTRNLHVVKATFQEKRVVGDYYPYFRFSIEEELMGGYAQDSVWLLGQDGLNCNYDEYDGALSPGEEIYLVFSDAPPFSDPDLEGIPDTAHDFGVCGYAYLRIAEDGSVVGPLGSEVVGTYSDTEFRNFLERSVTEGRVIVSTPLLQRVLTAPLLSPNPATDAFTVHLPEDDRVHHWTLYDTQGRQLRQRDERIDPSASGPEIFRVDVSDLPPGLYFLGITSAAGRNVQPVIVR